MGCSVVAACPCGYTSPLLMVGGGMSTFETVCAFPACCSTGRHLVTVNMFDNPLRCPDGHEAAPIPYDDKTRVKKPGRHVVPDWNVGNLRLRLTDGSYLCPACLASTLTFSKGDVIWD